MPHWIVDLAIDRTLTLPSGDQVDRDGFFEWLWAQCGTGLVGVDEGSVDVDEACALGLVESARVLDAAVAPPDRDWVRRRPTQTAACWFAHEAGAHAAARLLADVRGCTVLSVRRAPEAEASADWRAAFSPIMIPNFGTIRPAWDEGVASASEEGSVIFIDPGAGFGTGLHETTQLCLQSLAAWRAMSGSLDRVLDFGSGSGILGIAAAICGAAHVDAIEIDVAVHDAIRANAARNGVADRLRIAPSLPADEKPYDLVFANIVAPVLLDHARELCGRLRRDRRSCLVLSGLLADEVPAAMDRYAAMLGVSPAVMHAGDWHCLRFTTPNCLISRTLGLSG